MEGPPQHTNVLVSPEAAGKDLVEAFYCALLCREPARLGVDDIRSDFNEFYKAVVSKGWDADASGLTFGTVRYRIPAKVDDRKHS